MCSFIGDIFLVGVINNKRDTIFLNIKIDIKIVRVIITLTTILQGYRDSALLQRLGRVHQGTEAI